MMDDRSTSRVDSMEQQHGQASRSAAEPSFHLSQGERQVIGALSDALHFWATHYLPVAKMHEAVTALEKLAAANPESSAAVLDFDPQLPRRFRGPIGERLALIALRVRYGADEPTLAVFDEIHDGILRAFKATPEVAHYLESACRNVIESALRGEEQPGYRVTTAIEDLVAIRSPLTRELFPRLLSTERWFAPRLLPPSVYETLARVAPQADADTRSALQSSAARVVDAPRAASGLSKVLAWFESGDDIMTAELRRMHAGSIRGNA